MWSRRPSPRAALAVVSLALACSGADHPPLPPVPDAGPVERRDGSAPIPDAGSVSGRRDGGPVLPPADVEVVLPYLGPEVENAIGVEAAAGRLDVFLSIDTTGSFADEIDALQSEMSTRILPSIRARVEDVAFGVGRFEDFPVAPFGAPTDRPFTLLSPITTSFDRVAGAVAALDEPLGDGGDTPESSAEALFQIATGDGFRLGGLPVVAPFSGPAAPGGGTLGGVGFRREALHVVVHVTDAPSHAPGDYLPDVPGAHSLDDATRALASSGARVIGIASGSAARPHLERVAIDTLAFVSPVGGRCATGIDGSPRDATAGVCPLVFDIDHDGTGLSDAVADSIVELVNSIGFSEVWGEGEDDRLHFVRTVEARDATVAPAVPPPGREDLRPPDDGVLDTFTHVGAGTSLVLVAHLRNTTIPPADYDQIFRVTIAIHGDDVVLARRVIRVVVPRDRLARPDGGAMDASTDGPTADGGGAG